MAPLSPSTMRVVRAYEPVFRSMLMAWLEAHVDSTGNTALTMSDVSAGVSHVFGAFQQGIQLEIGDSAKSLEEYNAGQSIDIDEAINELHQAAA
jgi:hypothetical protein